MTVDAITYILIITYISCGGVMETEHDILYRKWNQEEIVPMHDWFLTLLIMFIPILNIVMILRWSLSPNTNPNKLNFIKAGVIIFALTATVWWLITYL